MKTGDHILTITGRSGDRFKSAFDATCSCRQWRYDKAVVASEQEGGSDENR